ncbi:succinate dehydrogenase, hydrophobic membrane anchor protein [Paracoccaceae bacterium Fryx2]|nr:succinate dehydrogenase, hydrophobic membrane anchor protein [Paracoccaceae bacterium Fryx2]
MRYITDRKRANGMGAANHGTGRHWYMMVSAVGLAALVPIFIYYFGTALGQGHEAVIAIFSRPLPAILTALVLFFGMRHFAEGATVMIEDYAQGITRRLLVICAQSFSYGLMAIGLFALAKIAL